ncbi:MAG: hypothetical protein H0W90_06785 [Actinobacteria bacterium]|nr:hypothetical protein [Actinomycetota bacterium]
MRCLALPLVFDVAASYHAWQSMGHLTPMIFDNELLYEKLSQSIAAGHGLSIRGEPFFFPRPACAARPVARVQFLILPVVYLAAIALCGRGNYRRHALPAVLVSALVAALLFIPGALGTYGGATPLRPAIGPLAHWVLINAALLPFALGLAVVPGAFLGVGYMLAKPRTKLEHATAAMALGCTVLFIGQAALVSTAEAHRPLERYLFYCTPLVFLASGSPTAALGLYIDVPETPLDGRVLGLKVRDLRYVTGNSTFDALHRRS